MALTWDAKRVPEADRNDPLFQKAIWNLMAIKVGSLTEKTLPEAIARTRIYEGLNGPQYYTAKNTPVYLWPELHRFVGLKTNVSRMTRTQWLKWQFELAVQDATAYAQKARHHDGQAQ
jgi:hypothetical protein